MSNRNQKWNDEIIAEFRANGGSVDSQFRGRTLTLLHHIGRRTGVEHINPLACLPVGESLAVFGSAAGADKHPDWYHNLMAQPNVTVEFVRDVITVRARELFGEERQPIWEQQKQVNPEFQDYEARASRVIPVVLLERRSSGD